MKQYELMKSAESVLNVLAKNNIDIKDVERLKMYEDYARLKSEGHKMTYIVYYLTEQYSVGAATVYLVAKRMEQNIRL